MACLQDKGSYWKLARGTPNANLEPGEVLASLQVLHNAAHAIVAAMPALGTQPDFTRGQIQVIMDHQNLL